MSLPPSGTNRRPAQDCAPILILTGETASGKSEFAVRLAEKHDAEIIGADSRQIYRGMPIGTAAPTPEQRARVRHHLVEFLDPFERYSVARYVADALACIEDIRSRNKGVIVVGGTGFYIRALCGDVDLGPEVDEHARARVRHEANLHDASFLYDWLCIRDAKRSAELSPGDTYRVTRALETALAGPHALPQTVHRNLRTLAIPYRKIWRRTDQESLQRNITERVDRMLAVGFLDEAERIGDRAVAASAVGYPQASAYFAGYSTYDELRTLMIRNTRRYAKRQATWLRSEPDLAIFSPGEESETNRIVSASLAEQWKL